MTSRSQELERFKREIDLRQFAASHGYAVDHKASSPSGTVMRGGDGSKLRIARGTDGHYVYWNAHDDSDSGSVIDFIQQRTSATLGEVRQQLRPWIGEAGTTPPPPQRIPAEMLSDLVPVSRDLAAVQVALDGMEYLAHGAHRHLNDERGIPARLLAAGRFSSSVLVDARGNAVFPHQNEDGACGFELKNSNWTGFAKGGAKGLWVSACSQADSSLVFAESGVDALSYAALHGYEVSRFMSLSGQPSPEQMKLVERALVKMPQGEVILALDNDEAGDLLTARLENLFSDCPRSDLTLRVHRPASRSWDWSAVLQEKARTGLEPPSPT